MDDVTHWRFGDVAERLLGGRRQYQPPPGWPCWREPTPALPIDRAITALRESNREPRLRPQEQLGLCPYYGVRWAIAMAADAATVAASDDAADMAERWRVQVEEARKAGAALAVLTESLLHPTTQTPMTRWPMLEPAEVTQSYNAIFMLQRSGALDRLSEHARRARQFFENNQGAPEDVWRLVFCADLGFTWRLLTGANPARTEPFINFVAAAYESLDAPAAVSWERSVRRALGLELDWDELLAAERHRQERATLSWPQWFAAVHGVDLANPPYADGQHLKPGAGV
jgi:hypothetical protein